MATNAGTSVAADKTLMEEKAVEAKKTHDDLEALLNELMGYLSGTVRAAWEGVGGDSFGDELVRYTSSKNMLLGALADLTVALNGVTNHLHDTEAKIQNAMHSMSAGGGIYAGLQA
ncbi:WXG100 family type VII secretion target [Dactylosporangium roseum]|uniref:WXG100 family type VII secretion target n=1 Tax=Dactylosporangium roseum TaxID=47989 RepID=A0ABY5YYM8_9ACTN|nr:WXG100 family type VII secretion target [Dactylosporangium roseum]UWZ34622.1 WXG100 family type VII secretion target [Dactylosporangium roseum]